MTPEEAFLAEVSLQIDECMAKIADPRWRIEDRTIARNLPPLEAQAACQPWCGRALPDDGVAAYGFIDGPGDEREFFKLSGATCRRKGYVLGWCSMKCRDRAARPAEANPVEAAKARWRERNGQPAEQPAPAKGAPKCGNNDCETPLQNVAQRWCPFSDGSGRVMLEWSCEPCHLRDEAEFAELTPTTGAPYKGPALIDRRLTHSPMWPDDDGGA